MESALTIKLIVSSYYFKCCSCMCDCLSMIHIVKDEGFKQASSIGFESIFPYWTSLTSSLSSLILSLLCIAGSDTVKKSVDTTASSRTQTRALHLCEEKIHRDVLSIYLSFFSFTTYYLCSPAPTFKISRSVSCYI